MTAYDGKALALQAITESGIKPGQYWQHRKGGIYTIMAVGIFEISLEPVVVYVSEQDGTVWVRLLEHFLGSSVQDNRLVPRFVKINSLEVT